MARAHLRQHDALQHEPHNILRIILTCTANEVPSIKTFLGSLPKLYRPVKKLSHKYKYNRSSTLIFKFDIAISMTSQHLHFDEDCRIKIPTESRSQLPTKNLVTNTRTIQLQTAQQTELMLDWNLHTSAYSSRIEFRETPPILGLMRAILLLFRSRVVRRFRCGKPSSFTISLSDKSMLAYWS